MAVNLSRQRDEAIRSLEAKAKAAYDAGNDAEAAELYERAAQLLLRHAEAAAGRKIEAARKARAAKFREYATALRSGDIPKPEATATGEVTTPTAGGALEDGKGRGPRGRGKAGGKAEDEVHQAVTGLLHHSSITWDKIGGLDETKREVKYALGVSLAKKPPGLQLATWRNVLFYGPPGTGKTLLAAATSRALKTTDREQAVFFNVKVSSIMSKYFGESTKIISELYGTARDMSPAVIFLDEFESLCGSRNEGDTGTERRILSTILSELDGLAEKGREDIYVLTIAATNRPWDLDPAVLSRFDKKILIPLPDPETRRAILDIHLSKKGFTLTCELDELVDLTEGLSGREIESLAKEVTNRMVAEENRAIPDLVDRGLEAVKEHAITVRPLGLADFERARKLVHPVTTPEQVQRYVDWRDAAEA
ncbi:MAG: ATP-binding protein [Planctomycetes bacterium]|nr:ATP-binding protein [Planctomycetota bacterium]